MRQSLIDALVKIDGLISDYESPPQHVKIYDCGLDARRVCTQEDVDLMVEALDKYRKIGPSP